MKQFRVLETQKPYSGFFQLLTYTLQHTLFRGGWSDSITRELFHRSPCVAVVLYDPVHDNVILIEQFRVGAMQVQKEAWLLEIVAGAIEPDESPDQVAIRETREEAGCEILQLIRICEFFTSPGACSEKIHLYCGLVDSSSIGGIHGLEEEQEDIRVEVVSFDEAMRLLHRGRIESAIPIIGLQWLSREREQLQLSWQNGLADPVSV